MKLFSDKNLVLENLEVASTFWPRAKGLLGRKDLPLNAGLWILRTNSVHTFFMQFPLDLVFLNRHLVVTKVIENVPPGRLILPVWRASSVLELRAGFIKARPIRVGEKLNVDSTLS